MSKYTTRIALAITALGAILRFYRYNALSLWFDEGVTIYLARMPWHDVLFNLQTFDTHPPGHIVALKLVTYVLPEIVAGRLLSVICGIATIWVVYLLGKRIMDERAALVAAFVLAISPLHIWYSQEARPYAGVALLVAISYLALVIFHQKPSWRPAILYAVSTLFALYYDYSALYALAPQVLIILYTVRVHRKQVLPLFAAGIAALVLFIPGAITMLTTVDAMTQEREAGLGANGERIGSVTMSVTGVLGHDRYFLGSQQTLWEKGNLLHWLAGLAILIVVLYAIVLLVRRARTNPLAIMVTLGLSFGTLLVGIIISQYKPGFAERTVLTASLGWALLIGAATLGVPRLFQAPRRLPVIAAVLAGWALLVVFAYSTFTLYAIYSGGDKDHWRDIAADSEMLTGWGFPLITYHPAIPVLLDIYEPHITDTNTIEFPGQDAEIELTKAKTLPPAVWIDSIELPGVEVLRSELVKLGYTQILHNNYSQHSLNPIYMDLYAQPSAAQQLLHNMWPAANATGAQGWALPPTATLRSVQDGGGFVFPDNQAGEMRAIQTAPAQPRTQYSFTFQGRAQLESGRVRAFLICTAPNDKWLAIAPDDGGATEPSDGAWHTVSVTTLCPADTTGLLLDIRNAGVGTVEFKDFTLDSVSPTP